MDNLICAKCNKKIEEADLVECPHCWEMYHRECWNETVNCLSCKKYNVDFGKSEKEKADEENQQAENIEKKDGFKAENIDYDERPRSLGKLLKETPTVNAVMMSSMAVLILGVAASVICVVSMFISNGLNGGILGLCIGAVIIVLGWILSVLIKGFAELIDNSHKNTYYLSKLVEKQEEKEEEKWEN